MKKLITTVAGVLLVNLSALAQGTITLQNVGPAVNAPVRDPSGALIAAGAPITIELLAGTTAASVAPFATPVTTTTWLGGGFFGGGEKVLQNFPAGSFPFFQLRAWDNTGGINTYAGALAAGKAYYAFPLTPGLADAPFQLVAGGGLNGLGNPAGSPPVPAPALFGMPTGWQLTLVPEPSTILLGVLGAAALLFRRRK
jgi:hypothetical protein